VAKFSRKDGAWGEVLRGTHGLTPEGLEDYLAMRVAEYSKGFTWLPKKYHLQWLKKEIVTIDGRKWADWRYVPMPNGATDYQNNPVYTRFLTTLLQRPASRNHLHNQPDYRPQVKGRDRSHHGISTVGGMNDEAKVNDSHRRGSNNNISPIRIVASSVLALDHSGNLFFEGSNTGTILKFAPDGTKTTFAVSDAGTALNADLAVDAAGNLYACANFTTVLKFAPDGVRTTFATKVGTYWQNALAVDAAGNLYVGTRGAILKFAPDGTRTTFATGVDAYGLVFDNSGNLFAADNHYENDRAMNAILKFTPDGTRSVFANIRAYALAFDRSGISLRRR